MSGTAQTGELVHIDVKQRSSIPDGGRGVCRARRSWRHRSITAYSGSCPVLDSDYVHIGLDDRSQAACIGILHDERQDVAAAFLGRARAWYTAAGFTIERVLRTTRVLSDPGRGSTCAESAPG